MIPVIIFRTALDLIIAVGLARKRDWAAALLWFGFFLADVGTIALMRRNHV